MKTAGIDMDELRAEVATAAGAEVPDLVKLRRVTWWTRDPDHAARARGGSGAVGASNVDWEQLRRDLADACWGWIAAGFVVAQLPRLTQAASTLGSIAARLPSGRST